MTPAARPPRGRVRGSGTAGLLVATGSFRATQNMAQTTLSLLGRELGLGGSAIGAVAAGANLVGVATMVLLTARLATSSARRAVFVSLLLLAASLATFLVPAQLALFSGAALLGVAGGLALPSVATAVGDRTSDAVTARVHDRPADQSRVARARALAALGLVLSVSLALGPLYESAVLSVAHQRLRVAYLAFLPVALLGAVVARGRGRATGSPAAAPASIRSSMAGLGSLLRNRRWGLAVCGQAIYMVPFAVVVVFAGLLGKSLYHTSASTTEIGIAVFFVVSFLCRATLARRPAVGHRVALFGVSVLATLVGLALLAFGANVAWFMVALAVLGAPHGLTYPLGLALVAESVASSELSRANAGFQAVSNAINVVAPLLLGVLIDHLGDRDMLVCAAVPVVALAGVLWRLRDAG